MQHTRKQCQSTYRIQLLTLSISSDILILVTCNWKFDTVSELEHITISDVMVMH